MAAQRGPGTREKVLAGLRPPIRSRRFWIVQLLVIVIALFHESADARLILLPAGIPDFATVSLFLVPIIFAALNFGLTGSFATAFWVTLLSLPDFFYVDRVQHHWVDGVQLAIIDVVAVLVGLRVEQERLARRSAEDAQQRAAAYAARVVVAHEAERRRVAQELHDDPLQALIHVSRRLDAMGVRDDLPDWARADLAETRGHLDAVVGTLRAMAQRLRPPLLDDLGLVTAVRRIAQDAGRRSAIEVAFSSTGGERRLDPAVELNLFRIAQEALNNVERHSAARSVQVGLSFAPRRVRLSVADDGVGFDGEAVDEEQALVDGHLGLLGMRERAAMLGGTVRVTSADGRGTVVVAEVPAAAAAGPV